MNLLLCGGGTAGHVNPAIAVAEELVRVDKNAKILFIGRKGGDENSLVEKARFKYKELEIEGLKRPFRVSNLNRLLKAFKAIDEACRIIKDFKPDVILGTGGYVCWPVIIEVQALVAAIAGLDAMVKAANVKLIHVEKRLGGRLVTVVVEGSVSDVR